MSLPASTVYKATYSNIDVYECTYNDIPIMRRCKDDWVNATQILKSCNFPKAKRTKILEKGVQLGLHEKVQGGFGRFQGTWVPLADAQRLANTYGLPPEHAPVLYLDLSDPNLNIQPRIKPHPKEPTPVKRKYVKKVKPLVDTPTKPSHGHSHSISMDLNDAQMGQYAAVSNSGGLFMNNFQIPFVTANGQRMVSQHQYLNINQIPTSLMNDQVKEEQQSMRIYSNNQMKLMDPPTFQSVQQNAFQTYPLQIPVSQASHQHLPNQVMLLQDHKRSDSGLHSSKFPQNGLYHSEQYMHSQFLPQHYNFSNSKLLSQSTIDLSHDDMSKPHSKESDTSMSSNDDLTLKNGNYVLTKVNSYSAQLLRFFSGDSLQIPLFLYNPPFDFNINAAIDDEGHTALHWAASIGNFEMISLLLAKRATPLVVNTLGLNPLSKLISFNNCYESRTFPQILDGLEPCLIHTDINGRTPLHYLTQFSKTRSKHKSLRYYLEIILHKLCTLRDTSPNDKIDLMRNVIDHRDVNGDTCLHLALFAGSMDFAKILLQHGARDDLENSQKKTVKQLIDDAKWIFDEVDAATQQQQPNQSFADTSNHELPTFGMSEPHDTHPFIMETPMQRSIVPESPDTQRTTIAGAESDDDYILNQSNISKRLLDTLDKIDELHVQSSMINKENKGNIFHGSQSAKAVLVTSTPQRSAITVHTSGSRPLAAISELTAESTSVNPSSKYHSQTYTIEGHRPSPPVLTKDGHVMISLASAKVKDQIVPIMDFSIMVKSMISSLGDNIIKESRDIENEVTRIRDEIDARKRRAHESLNLMRHELSHSGFERVNSFEDADNTVQAAIDESKLTLNKLDRMMHIYLDKKVVNLIQENQGKPALKQENLNVQADETFRLAIKLTQMQIIHKKQVSRYTSDLNKFSANDKMYKLRKLIGLSCGVRVEEIDVLIDRILQHLAEASV